MAYIRAQALTSWVIQVLNPSFLCRRMWAFFTMITTFLPASKFLIIISAIIFLIKNCKKHMEEIQPLYKQEHHFQCLNFSKQTHNYMVVKRASIYIRIL